MECLGQFVGKPSVRSLVDEGLNGGDERAVPRKPNGIVGPEAGLVEADRFTERVVAAAMSIAGQVVEEFEFAKDGEAGGGAEGLFEFRESSNFVAKQVFAEELGIEGEGSHNVIVPIDGGLHSELYHNENRARRALSMRLDVMITGSTASTTPSGAGVTGLLN
ncbi:MAG: hypothetical protein FJW31_14010 [Acidobacteria bacterium]|nr:hypothetical protein [Acidobacteriota bacterium]